MNRSVKATEHFQVSGWGGVPGECGVECACGVTYDGFDTLAEAYELLALHTAQAEPVAARPRRRVLHRLVEWLFRLGGWDREYDARDREA